MAKLYYGREGNKPHYARPEFLEVLEDLKLIDDELGGTRTMHRSSQRYISKWRSESQNNYDRRRKCETFFEGLGRTLSAAVGMLFARAPVMTWNKSESALSPLWDNIDAAGAHGDVFTKRFAEASLRDGIGIILVDHSSPPRNADGSPRVPDAEEESALGLRPIWTAYDRSQAINWKVSKINNHTILSLLVLAEGAEVDDGDYGSKSVHRYRVLKLTSEGAVWELHELIENDGQNTVSEDKFKLVDSGRFTNRNGEPARFLPVAIAYVGKTTAPLTGAIPLLGVAWANLGHWQLSTDLRFNTEVAAFAQPVVEGKMAIDPVTGKEKPLMIGPLALVNVDVGSKYYWAEISGASLERLATLVLEKLRQIAALGVSFLQTDTRAAETAEAKRLDAAAENATLATAGQGIEDCLNLALEYTAWYEGIPKEGAPTLSINTDFEDNTIASDVMTAYVSAVSQAGLPIRLMLQAWQQGGRISQDEDLDELEAEMMADLAAKEAAEAEKLEAMNEQQAVLPPGGRSVV